MIPALRLMQLFQGSDLAFGRTEPLNKVSSAGKQEARCWTEKRAVTQEDWQKHLDGLAGLGIPPLNSRSMVRFGAIDVDTYKGLDLADLACEITRLQLPLVLCRSKSGGPHLFLFVADWVPADLMISKLDALAGTLGFGTSEIFPKQTAISTQNEAAPDYGNWINMPYFGGTRNLRYGLDKHGDALTDIELFLKFCHSRTINPAELESMNLMPDTELFIEGPPCLNYIFTRNSGEYRNISLANAAVYAKKAHPDNWKEKVEEYNRLFRDPLPSNEVEAIKKSYEKKEYRYQCSKQPLCSFCNSSTCKQKEFGIGDDETLPNNRSLTVINTVPPIWYLDIQSQGRTDRISLTTEELQNPRLFQKRCMEVIKQMPPVKKAEEWQEIVKNLLRYVTQIDMPPETSPEGEFIEHLQSFITERKQENSPQDMLRGSVFHAPTSYYFRWRDLTKYLDNQKFDSLKQNQLLAVLRNQLKGEKQYQKIAGVGVNYWEIPKESMITEAPERLTVITAEEPF